MDRKVVGRGLKSGQESIGTSFRSGRGGQAEKCVGNLQAMTEKGGIFKKLTNTKGSFGIETTQKHLS
jgi:hypothetical protein